jgi:hypothetical protein
LTYGTRYTKASPLKFAPLNSTIPWPANSIILKCRMPLPPLLFLMGIPASRIAVTGATDNGYPGNASESISTRTGTPARCLAISSVA